MIQFHVLSFEGPDAYARAGGLASRITGLTEALADAGLETHLWFVGDPALPGHERRDRLHLHRWCQWISGYHPGGVYDGEEGKRADYASSLPPFLVAEVLLPHLGAGGRAIVLAEEWQTVDAVLHLDWLLRCAGLRQAVSILWNANNTCGFERIDWWRLARAALITTVSRYMRQWMWSLGVDPLVIPNGLSAEAFAHCDRGATAAFRRRIGTDRVVLGKIARWDPDKRWLLAIDTVGALKRDGGRPLLIARGGVEAHGAQVLAKASAAGLRVVERSCREPSVRGLLDSLSDLRDADIVSLRSHVSPEPRRVLFHSADAVLANSRHEPFGLVGLETMAAGGLACTGGTGEDYAVPGWNALVLQRNDPREFVNLFHRLQADPGAARALRQHGKSTAQQYAWPHIIRRHFLSRLQPDGDGRESEPADDLGLSTLPAFDLPMSPQSLPPNTLH